MQEEIFRAVESVVKSDARVLVIKGDGENFCLGGDVRDWLGVPVDKLRPCVEGFANALARLLNSSTSRPLRPCREGAPAAASSWRSPVT
jgi:enoyl-CoA hydratase/carnithine racemase